jgi:hypothetical protein
MGEGTNIRDELEEFNFFVKPRILIAEYIPFGRNAIVAFNTKLDSFKRVKSSLITAFQDETPGGTQFRIKPTETKIDVLDFHSSEFIKFNAEVFYPEEKGIVQEERFGIYLNQSGKIVLGMKVKEIGKQIGTVSIDLITRLFSDVIFDSSELLDTLLTNHQRRILELVFFDRPFNRDKYVSIIAKKMEPDRPMGDYFDGEDNENEIKQILEYVDKSMEWDDGTKLFVGTHGLIMLSEEHEEYDMLVANFGFLKSVEIFLSNYFSRVWSLEDDIKEIRRKATEDFESDPRSVGLAQTKLSELSQNCILLEETREHMESALIDNLRELHLIYQDLNEKQKKLADFLELELSLKGLLARIRDTKKMVVGLNNDVEGLRDQVNVINEKRLQSIFHQLKDSSSIQMRMTRAAERQDSKMQVLQIIFSGTLAFDLLQLITGEFSYTDQNLQIPNIFGVNIGSQWLWAFMNLGFWFIFAMIILKVLKTITIRAEDNMVIKIEYGIPINLEILESVLGKESIMTGDIEHSGNKILRTVDYFTNFGGSDAKLTITYDTKNSFLYTINLDLDTPKKSPKAYKKLLDNILHKKGILLN